jgi:hypothetical protein
VGSDRLLDPRSLGNGDRRKHEKGKARTSSHV